MKIYIILLAAFTLCAADAFDSGKRLVVFVADPKMYTALLRVKHSESYDLTSQPEEANVVLEQHERGLWKAHCVGSHVDRVTIQVSIDRWTGRENRDRAAAGIDQRLADVPALVWQPCLAEHANIQQGRGNHPRPLLRTDD